MSVGALLVAVLAASGCAAGSAGSAASAGTTPAANPSRPSGAPARGADGTSSMHVVPAPEVEEDLVPLGVEGLDADPAGAGDGGSPDVAYAAAEAALDDGWSAYRDLRLDRAWSIVDDALTDLTPAGAPDPRIAGLERRLRRLGALIRLVQGDDEAAREVLRPAVAAALEERADPGRFPPRFVALEAAVRDDLLRSPPRFVAVRSTPPGATLRLDGRIVGDAPATLSVGPGPHTLRAELPAFRPAVRALAPDLGGPSRDQAPVVSFPLDPAGRGAIRNELARWPSERLGDLPTPARQAAARALGAPGLLRVRRDDQAGGRWEAAYLDLAAGRLALMTIPGNVPPDQALAAFTAWAGRPGADPAVLADPAPGPSNDPRADDRPLRREPWLWVAVGVVVAGAATLATGLALGGRDEPAPVVTLTTR